jgi:hypothetical protein
MHTTNTLLQKLRVLPVVVSQIVQTESKQNQMVFILFATSKVVTQIKE